MCAAPVRYAAARLPTGRSIEPRADATDAAAAAERAVQRSRWREFVRASAQI